MVDGRMFNEPMGQRQAEESSVWSQAFEKTPDKNLKWQLIVAKNRREKAQERLEAARNDLRICREVMNEEFASLQEEIAQKEKRHKAYEELRDANNSKISAIKKKIERLRPKERECFDRSKKAYHSTNNRGRATGYAEQGERIRQQRKSLYEEMHELGAQVRERRLEIEANNWVDDRFYLAARDEFLAAKRTMEIAQEDLCAAEREVENLESELDM